MLCGESLGSFGTESAFVGIDDLIASTDGSLLVGPVCQNEIHSQVTNSREQDSPFWLPVYEAGHNLRFAVSPADLSQPETEWPPSRSGDLQNAAEPNT